MKIRLIQHLCPERHCIMGLAYVSESGEPEPAQLDRLRAMERELLVDPWCGLCKSRQLVYDDQPTIFKTMEEARVKLREQEEAQVLTREWWNASRS